MPRKVYPLCFAFLFLLITIKSQASHLRAGEITAERISCTSLTFRITITVYIDTESGVKFGGTNWLDFGDSTDPNKRSGMVIPVQETIPRPDLGKNMGMASFTTDYTYSGFGTYTISYQESFRNAKIVNMDASDATDFYVETTVILDPFLSCNRNLPKLLIPPIDRACTGVAFFHNPGAVDLDKEEGDSLSYAMVIPKQATNTLVWNYKEPVDSRFYVNYQNGNEEKNGPPGLTIDPVTGTIRWDAPGAAHEYNIAFIIIEWRKDPTGVWNKMSTIRRDMQIIVEDCDNNRPDLIVPNDTCVTAGTILNRTIFGIDPENDPVKIEVFSDIISLSVSPATYTPRPEKIQPSNPPAKLEFEWKTQCEHVKEQYYQVVFKITDNPVRGPKLVTFKTWRIKVVGPPPVWQNASVDLTKRNAKLEWENYACEKATQMQVWRKIDGVMYSPGNCETGMPNLGYDLISTVNLRDPAGSGKISQFIDTNNDKGLAPGAAYCYRLVAIFPDPRGGESYVSLDTCLAPILADAPVITHVSVEKTHKIQGAIRVSWYSPFQISRSQYPGPYEYAVYRANGFEGTEAISATSLQRTRDTTFVDQNINTEDQVYNYRIVLYSNTSADPVTWVAVDTSAVASLVRLEASALTDDISLSWKAQVPWSNTSDKFPFHLIFRGTGAGKENNFVLIDSVNAQEGEVYIDRGQYNNLPIDKNETYGYRVLTRGVYGNKSIREPLENYSQTIWIKPDEDGLPCPPVLSINAIDCDEVFASSQCYVKDFSNKIFWRSECEVQVTSYRIYSSSGPDNEFVMVTENVRDTFYIDRNLASFARCYKITAVDRHGNESAWSETLCNDNCPYFELPNIFTPNGDDCNEYFSAYGPFNPLNQSAPESCVLGSENYAKCLRFVKKVSLSVFNRWGTEVYTYKSGSENSTYVNWDGRDNGGRWLSSGVYYYLANVTFDAMDVSKQHQVYKGWIHLVK